MSDGPGERENLRIVRVPTEPVTSADHAEVELLELEHSGLLAVSRTHLAVTYEPEPRPRGGTSV